MRIVADTNVLMSGIFFGGVPGRILAAWREERFELAVSPDIADEYVRAGERPAQRFAGVDVRIIPDLAVRNAEVVPNTVLPEPVCDGPDDDKFLSLCVGRPGRPDRQWRQEASRGIGYGDVVVATPREFSDQWL